MPIGSDTFGPVLPTSDPHLDIIGGGFSGITPLTSGGTITFQYPPARALASYVTEIPAYLTVRAMQAIYKQDIDFTVSLGPTSITVTWINPGTIPANVPITLQLPVRDTSGMDTENTLGTTLPDSIQVQGI